MFDTVALLYLHNNHVCEELLTLANAPHHCGQGCATLAIDAFVENSRLNSARPHAVRCGTSAGRSVSGNAGTTIVSKVSAEKA